jgi:hypothetical protein
MGGIKNAKLLSIFNVSYCHRFASKQRFSTFANLRNKQQNKTKQRSIKSTEE